MANSLLTTDLILDRALAVLSQSPVFLDKINRQYDGRFARSGVKVGDTVSIKVPMRATIRDASSPTCWSDSAISSCSPLCPERRSPGW